MKITTKKMKMSTRNFVSSTTAAMIAFALCIIGIGICYNLQQVTALSSSSPSPKKILTTTTSTATTTATATSTATHWNRRQLFQNAIAAVATSSSLQPMQPAHAGGLLQFPITKQVPLKNKYHLMRAGWSELEHDGIYSTNPLFLTNRENQMHSPSGNSVVKQALQKLPQNQLPTVTFHSLAANGMDTGDLIARELKLGRDRLLPEFTYLDQRGIGLWDSSDVSIVKPALMALDELEAGPEGFGARPPPIEDGTPNETLHDQFIRLRQFISLQESRTAGETILIIFPDGTGPALLSCMIAGIPFNKVHVLDMVPGDLRLDVTPESILKLYNERKDSEEYLAMIEDGKEKLATLRQKQKDGTLQEYINLKDSKAEEERQELDRQLQEKKLADEARALERKKQDEARAQAVAETKQKAEEERRRMAEEKKEKERQKQQELAAVARRQAAARQNSGASTSSKSSDDPSVSFGAIAGTAGLGVLGLGALAVGAGSAPEANMTTTKSTTINANTTAAMANTTATIAILEQFEEEFDDSDDDAIATLAAPIDMNPSKAMDEMEDDQEAIVNNALLTFVDDDEDDTEISAKKAAKPVNEDALQNLMAGGNTKEKNFGRKMETAEKQYKDALVEAAEVKAQKRKSQKLNIVQEEKDPYMPDYDDDGANDWLRVLTEIRDEDEVEEDGVMDDEEELVLVNGNQSKKEDDSGPTNSTLSKDI